jgi:hypothetical protein
VDPIVRQLLDDIAAGMTAHELERDDVDFKEDDRSADTAALVGNSNSRNWFPTGVRAVTKIAPRTATATGRITFEIDSERVGTAGSCPQWAVSLRSCPHLPKRGASCTPWMSPCAHSSGVRGCGAGSLPNEQ